jgi:hypothetical protein
MPQALSLETSGETKKNLTSESPKIGMCHLFRKCSKHHGNRKLQKDLALEMIEV